ncbi:MAG: SHOCT domain-containing protein [Gemmatimonadaceae bacterium]|nr:SHOCT domain-containing protein [Gemmatimonadaceae bacterium]
MGKLTQPPAFVANLVNTAAAKPAVPVVHPATAPGTTPVAATEATIFEQLTQLGKLRDSGILTPQEFDHKKAELLSRL